MCKSWHAKSALIMARMALELKNERSRAMERKAEISRRDFLKGTAAAGASAAMLEGSTPARVLGG